jgi:hypothetical protein
MCGNYVREEMRREGTTATDATVEGMVEREKLKAGGCPGPDDLSYPTQVID